jgi:hypothetical protein
MDKKSAEHLAKALALACVRNGFIEELPCGKGGQFMPRDLTVRRDDLDVGIISGL